MMKMTSAQDDACVDLINLVASDEKRSDCPATRRSK